VRKAQATMSFKARELAAFDSHVQRLAFSRWRSIAQEAAADRLARPTSGSGGHPLKPADGYQLNVHRAEDAKDPAAVQLADVKSPAASRSESKLQALAGLQASPSRQISQSPEPVWQARGKGVLLGTERFSTAKARADNAGLLKSDGAQLVSPAIKISEPSNNATSAPNALNVRPSVSPSGLLRSSSAPRIRLKDSTTMKPSISAGAFLAPTGISTKPAWGNEMIKGQGLQVPCGPLVELSATSPGRSRPLPTISRSLTPSSRR